LDGSLQLPSLEEMRALTDKELERRRADGLVGSRLAHSMGLKLQAYFEQLAQEANIEPLPPVFTKLFGESIRCLMADLYGFRNARYKIVDRNTFERV
jgi:dimethylaniline monooxygenase (N-oxide forming)